MLDGVERLDRALCASEYQGTLRVLVGTWAAADWAIGFYRRHGFELVVPQRKDELLRIYWDIPEHQIETSVVLASSPFGRAYVP